MDWNGHVSGRDEHDPNVMWINNRHASRSTLTADDIVPYDIAAGKRIGEGMVASMGDAPLVVLRQHGVVVVGDCVEAAVVKLICTEENARQQYRAESLGTAR